GTTIVAAYFIFVAMSFSTIDSEVVCSNLDIRFVNPDTTFLLSKTEIENILSNSKLHPLNKKYRNINIDSIENILRHNTMIKNVECYNIPSGKIILNIEQRKPLFLVMDSTKYFIDHERRAIPFSSAYNSELIVVSGYVSEINILTDMYNFVEYINNDEFWLAEIEQIYVRQDKKIELVTKMGDAVVLLGTLDNYASKLNKLYALYKEVFSVKGWNKYNYINLEYRNQIVCNIQGGKVTI
ncbi:MAG: cell division protein FtsQ/DivIB, partial [Paludibacter sp.]|nr:cell division protein FtsQ/DivIB [Paludibacter sp.]